MTPRPAPAGAGPSAEGLSRLTSVWSTPMSSRASSASSPAWVQRQAVKPRCPTRPSRTSASIASTIRRASSGVMAML